MAQRSVDSSLFFGTETDVASAATCNIGVIATRKIRITGTTTITSFGASAMKERVIRFVGVLTLTHNATSLVLPGGASITTAAGDTALVVSDATGNWRVIVYQRASGAALVAGALTAADVAALVEGTFTSLASAATTNLGGVASRSVFVTGTTTITSFGTVPFVLRYIIFQGALTLTHNATTLQLPGGANITTAAGDRCIATSNASGQWTVLNYTRASGKAITPSALSEVGISGALGLVDWATLASAATTDLGAQTSNFVSVTGTTTITGLGTAAATVWRFVRFTGALILTHNATSLILPGGANITTAAGDCALFKSEGSGNWRCVFYTKASGKPTIPPTLVEIVPTGDIDFGDWVDIASAATTAIGGVASNFVRITGTTTITGFGTAAATNFRFIRFAGILTLAHNATSLILPGGVDILTAANDGAFVKSEGSGNWRVIAYWRAKAGASNYFFKAQMNASQTGVTDALATKVSFDSEVFDFGGNYDAATNFRWTPPAGTIIVSAQINVTGTFIAGALLQVSIYKNGVNVQSGFKRTASTGGDIVQMTFMDVASGTDYYECYALGDVSSGTVTFSSTGSVWSGAVL